jgi:hypothetical protein
MEIIKLEIRLSDADVRRFFNRHGLTCKESIIPVVGRFKATKSEKVLMVIEPHSNIQLNAKDAMLRIIQRRTIQLLLDDAEKSEVFMQLREMGKEAEKKFLGI